MDDYERTTRRVSSEDVVGDPLATPVVPGQPVYAAQPGVPAQPAYPAQPVAATPMAAAPISASRDRIVTEREVVIDRPTTLEMARRIITLVFGILQALIIVRIILLLLIANRENDIVQLILNVTTPFIAPFRDMFSLSQVGRSGSVLDVAAIVALIGWTLIELLVFAFLNLGARRTRV